ncbi:MAG TPA: Uma2 family endonuclease [Candidatus Eremiobacteraceae bacterium]|nr:Uma2 family endonuclease [Candidatus Eremiobacteraceae bacterium]
MREIVLPETKPALEWVNGRALQKVSPQRKHALAQSVFVSALLAWAMEHGTGRVGTEWEFRVQPPGEDRRPLVPDVAYLSYDTLSYEADDEADIPRVAPDAAVEIMSPGDLGRDIEEKIRVYLAAGASVVFLVDTNARAVTACDRIGRVTFDDRMMLSHSALPNFSMSVRSLFEQPKPRGR